jgi:polynucleotide 5'-hydroxyl-kinase GRC3/NOL9
MEPLGRITVPAGWESMKLAALRGTILVVGAANTGKTTFARYLYHRLGAHHGRLAFVDGDMGQASLGPPTTMTLALGGYREGGFPPGGARFRAFVGDVSPAGHMLQTLVAAHKLVAKARAEGATAVVFDTDGMVEPARGGGALKRALVALLRPETVVALQRGSELEHLLVPLRRGRRTRVIDRRVEGPVRRRGSVERRAHRAKRFQRAFEAGRNLHVDWLSLSVVPSPSFTQHRLVAMEDEDGFVLALGIVVDLDRSRHVVHLHTPLRSLEQVETLHVGDVAVDPHSFRDSRLTSRGC